MITAYETLLAALPASPKTWLFTGVSGFIGSNLLETLLKLDQRVVELDNFATGHQHIGLRYFNIFGRRQDPNGAYAAVVPKWIASMIKNEPMYINGTGETSRDFCYIDNAVQANLLAATTENLNAVNQVYNVAVGDRTSLNALYAQLKQNLVGHFAYLQDTQPIYRDFRAGDVLHSLADISKAKGRLGYAPRYLINEGLEVAMHWYLGRQA
jgi:UDP-N-acetylglucosamine/UDP-N-acetylgalactosamine 4-epimerase